MILFALYYYDAPLLKSFLSHYCQFSCIDEILIQNQNWSPESTKYLLETVASYVDEYHKKIVILPSQFKKQPDKRGQFGKVGLPKIVSRITQFLQGKVCIWGAMDEVIFGDSYESVGAELKAIEESCKSKSIGVGYLRHHCVFKDGIFPCGGIPIQKWTHPDWRARILKSDYPIAHKGNHVHDNSLNVLKDGNWMRIIPVDGITPQSLKRQKYVIPTSLLLLHYHTLFRPSLDSIKWSFPKKKEIANIAKHPTQYINRLPLT